MICDRLYLGSETQSYLKMCGLTANLLLDKATAQAHQKETVKQQQPLLRGGPINKTTSEAPVGVVNKKSTSTNPGNSQASHLQNKKESPKEHVLVANLLLMTASTVNHVKPLATSVVNKVILNLFADLQHQ